MTADEIMKHLESLGSESYKKVMRNHGVPEPFFGVKISELQKIRKKIKLDYNLSKELFDTGNYDAMYLAGLIADDVKMTKPDLRGWLKKAHCQPLYEYTVAWVTAESKHGYILALEWIGSKNEKTATAGWSTLSSIVSIKEDEELDIPDLKQLLKQIESTIHNQPNYVRYCMNGFVIAVGCYVSALTKIAKSTAKIIGKVEVDMGNTSCKVPDAVVYIEKVEKRGTIGKKRKSAKC